MCPEPGTTALSFGGPRTFTPSAWEWGFRAEAARKAGDLAEARRILDEGDGVHPESAALPYWRARLEVAAGDEAAALAALRVAMQREPDLVGEARGDDVLGALVSRLPQAQEKEE